MGITEEEFQKALNLADSLQTFLQQNPNIAEAMTLFEREIAAQASAMRRAGAPEYEVETSANALLESGR